MNLIIQPAFKHDREKNDEHEKFDWKILNIFLSTVLVALFSAQPWPM
jgi:hypothetical protein